MNLRNIILPVASVLLAVACNSGSGSDANPVYKDPSAPVESRVKDLLKRMTIEEKALQLTQWHLGANDNPNNIITENDATRTLNPMLGSVIYTGEGSERRNLLQKRAIEETRLGIPIIFGYDVIHGYRTIYPISLAAACSWNPEMVRKCCAIAAREARSSGIDWTFSPMIDVARDPRWGRIAEGYGEDSYAASVFAAAAVQGYQGDDISSETNVASCLKHFVGYGASEAGRDYVQTDISDQTLWDTYLPPYEAAVKAGAKTLMSSFNLVNGIPGSSNDHTINGILRGMWGFDGMVVSDWASVSQIVTQRFAKDNDEASLMAIESGVDMDMGDMLYPESLPKLVEDGRLSIKTVDQAVARVLRLKFELGLFEHPYAPEYPDGSNLLAPEDVRTAEEAANETIVLLQNNGSILPLGDKVRKIAIVGPLAKDGTNMMGSWPGHGHGDEMCTIWDAFSSEYAGRAELLYASGCGFDSEDAEGFRQAVAAARKSDVVIACLGEPNTWSGESASRAFIDLPAPQQKLLEALHATGKPVVLLLVNGRPLELRNAVCNAEAVVEMWQPGIAGGKPAAGVITGRINPSGRLAATFPYTVGQIPIYYNRRHPARNGTMGYYLDCTVEPLYPFGYGLSYSTFEYGEITLSSDSIARDGSMTASVTVTNTSDRDGMETVFWFVEDPACSRVVRPEKELRHFEKQLVKAGESRTFTFEIDAMRDLSYVDGKGERFLESGEMSIIVAGRKASFNVL